VWFYLKDSPDAPLSVFSRHRIFEAPAEWKDGILAADLDKIDHHLATINFLRAHDQKGVGVIGAYHARRAAPLMRRVLPCTRWSLVRRWRGLRSLRELSPMTRSPDALRVR
jgi:hypothetical protein